MGTVQVRDIASVVQGGRLGLTKADYRESGVQAFSPQQVRMGFVSQAEFHQPGVILSSIGANCGRCFRADGSWTTLANTQAILPDSARVDHPIPLRSTQRRTVLVEIGVGPAIYQACQLEAIVDPQTALGSSGGSQRSSTRLTIPSKPTERVVTKLELQRQAVSQAMFGRTSWRVTTRDCSCREPPRTSTKEWTELPRGRELEWNIHARARLSHRVWLYPSAVEVVAAR